MSDATTTILRRPEGDQFGNNDYVALRVGKDFASVTSSTMKKGTNAHSGKSWSRFHVNACLILKQKHYQDGSPRYHAYMKTGKSRHRPSNFQDVTPHIAESHGAFSLAGNSEYRAVAIAAFFNVIGHQALPMGSEFLKLAYPILAQNPSWRWAPGMGSALRKPDTRSFVEEAFGKTRYRKDLVKAIGAAPSLDKVGQARLWRGLVPIDWIVDGISQSIAPPSAIVSPNMAHMRRILPLVDLGSRKRLLFQAMTNDRGAHFISDTLRSVDSILSAGDSLEEIGRVDGWRSLHDILATQARLAVTANRPIPQGAEVYKLLDGLATPSGLKIVSAKETDDLIFWGGQMSNCIGSYIEQAVHNSTCLFAIYKDAELVGNLEVGVSGRVRQIVGKFNSQFQHDAEIRESIAGAIESGGSKTLKESAAKTRSSIYDW